MNFESAESPLAYPIPQAAYRIGIGRTKFFHLLRSGQIASIKIGGKMLVTEKELRRFIASRVESEGSK